MSMKGKRTKSIGNALKNPSHSVELELSLVTILSFRGLENIAMPLLANFHNKYSVVLLNLADPLETDQVTQFFGRSEDGQYFCKACGLRCKAHSILRAHVQSKHYTPGYPCDDCGKVYSHKSSLLKHYKYTQCTKRL